VTVCLIRTNRFLTGAAWFKACYTRSTMKATAAGDARPTSDLLYLQHLTEEDADDNCTKDGEVG
jgi:hypothetical protein